jgi:hypothetical protein
MQMRHVCVRFVDPVTSMAACIASVDLDITWYGALLWLDTGYADRPWVAERLGKRKPDHYLHMAQMALDHIPYLEAERAERVTGLYQWLGAEAETA